MAKVEGIGTVAALETDLALGTDPTVRALQPRVAQQSQILTSLEPGHGLAPTFASRLADIPELSDIVDAFTDTLARPHLAGVWPLPDLPSASTQRILRGGPRSSWVMSCAVSASGALVGSSTMDGTIHTWRADTWAQVASIDAHKGAAVACAFTADEHCIVSGGEDGAVRLWDLASGRLRQMVTSHDRR